jgi:uncharacterized membrane protein
MAVGWWEIVGGSCTKIASIQTKFYTYVDDANYAS